MWHSRWRTRGIQGLPGKRPHTRPCSAGSAAHPTAPQDLLFSVCGLTIFSTIICTLSAVVCCIQIFSLDIVHVVSPSSGPGADGAGEQRSQAGMGPGVPEQDPAPASCRLKPRMHIPCWISGQGVSALSSRLSLQLVPQRSSSVTLECTSPPDTFLQSMMDFEEFVPPVPPPPYYPPEYTCSSETDAQRYQLGARLVEQGARVPPGWACPTQCGFSALASAASPTTAPWTAPCPSTQPTSPHPTRL